MVLVSHLIPSLNQAFDYEFVRLVYHTPFPRPLPRQPLGDVSENLVERINAIVSVRLHHLGYGTHSVSLLYSCAYTLP